MCPQKLLRIANTLMPASIAMMLAGAYVGFIDHDNWSLTAQVLAHIGLMLGAGFLKLGYVMHLNASTQLEVGVPAETGSGGPRTAELVLPECCLAGRPCL